MQERARRAALARGEACSLRVGSREAAFALFRDSTCYAAPIAIRQRVQAALRARPPLATRTHLRAPPSVDFMFLATI